MIKIQTGKRTVRETTAQYEEVDGDGKVTETEIRVLYYSYTTADLKARRASVAASLKNDPDEPVWHSALLADQIHSLPDLVDAKTNKPFEITEGFLDTLEVKNLDAIREAIENAIRPKEQPSK